MIYLFIPLIPPFVTIFLPHMLYFFTYRDCLRDSTPSDRQTFYYLRVRRTEVSICYILSYIVRFVTEYVLITYL
jgi:hypothetical protein